MTAAVSELEDGDEDEEDEEEAATVHLSVLPSAASDSQKLQIKRKKTVSKRADCEMIRQHGSASETVSEGKTGATDGGGEEEEGCAGPESSTTLPPPEGDSGVVGGVLSTELLPLLGNSCSLSFSICSSEASSSGPASCSALGSSRHGGAGGGGELAASVSESENNSLRVCLGHWAWMLDHTSFWPLERTAGLSSAFPAILALFSGISQNPAGLPPLVFSFIPLYFLEDEPLGFGRLRSLSSAWDSASDASSSSELLLDEAPLSSPGHAALSSIFLGEAPGSQSALLVLRVFALEWPFGVLSAAPSDFLFLLLCSPSNSGWLLRFPTSALSEPTPDSWLFPEPGEGLDASGGLPLSKHSDAIEDRSNFYRLDWRLLSPFVLTLVHLGKDILTQATLGAWEACHSPKEPSPTGDTLEMPNDLKRTCCTQINPEDLFHPSVMNMVTKHKRAQTRDCVLQGSPSTGTFCSSELEEVTGAPPAWPSDFTSTLGACFKGRSIRKVMAVEVQYSSNPLRCKSFEQLWRQTLHVLAVSTFDIVASG
ncbi:hypothetical protein EYF80_027115 [Liparis tanakae]|uniref:Uncharacterized protein n=1 Tax=Liparis tanakae TaxID=230148 RepID=A0A4Z2HCQ5_9TELE|nr:hypothetical protein EYF80_027115 [Liparis tanakae]